MVLWDVAARKRLVDEPLPVKEGDVRGVAFSPDGKTIAAGYSGCGDGGGVVLWDVAARKRLADEPLAVKEGDVESVAFSPDGKTIAAGYGSAAAARRRGAVGRGRTQRLADEPLPVKEGDVESVAFSPDGKTIAAGYGDRADARRRRGAVGRGRTQTPGRRAAPREGGRRWERGLQPGRQDHRGRIRRLDADVGGVVLWDVAARKRLVDEPLAVKEGAVGSVAFSPDGKTIAAGYGVDGRRRRRGAVGRGYRVLAAPRRPDRQSQLYPQGMA